MRWLPGTEILTWVVATRAPGYAHRPTRCGAGLRVASRRCSRLTARPTSSAPGTGSGRNASNGGLPRLGSTPRPRPAPASSGCAGRPRRRDRSPACSPTWPTRAVPVRCAPPGGRRRSPGAVRALGADLVAVAAAGTRGSVAVVALGAVCSVRTGPGVPAVAGDRPVELSSLRMADVLVGLAAEREPLRVVTADGETRRGGGRRRRAGRRDAADRDRLAATAYVPLAAVAAIVVGE